MRDFACSEETIVEIGRHLRDAQHQRRFGNALDVTGDQTVGRKIDDAVIGEPRTLGRGFAGVFAEMNIGRGNAEAFGNGGEFVGGVRQLR